MSVMRVQRWRYGLTRVVYRLLGLNITRWRREIERLWGLSAEDLKSELEEQLGDNKPVNSAGKAVATLAELSDSPSLTKSRLIANTVDDCVKNKRPGGHVSRHTSGTTGQPTQVILNRAELSRFLAVRDYCFGHYGLSLGEREGRFWMPQRGLKQRILNFLLNRKVVCPTGDDSLDQLEKLMGWNPDYLYGYSSLILEAARVLEGSGISFHPPKLVVCTAENILPAQKAFIGRIFQALVAEEYGSTEFDVLAFECSAGHRHLVNPWVILESGNETCLISDVSRESQSYTRYELGDAVQTAMSDCNRLGSESVVVSLEGRTINRFFYIAPDHKVHSSIFSRIIDRYCQKNGEVFTFLVRQEAYNQAIVFVDLLTKTGSEELRQFVMSCFEEEFGETIEVIVTNDPGQNQTGKRNYFVQKLMESV